jgi:antitoxin CptB
LERFPAGPAHFFGACGEDLADIGLSLPYNPREARLLKNGGRAFWRLLAGGRMSGTQRSSEGLDPRRRKILFRCWHRGMREVDLLLGRFADAHIDDLSEAELDQLEHLMEAQDADIFSWFAGSKKPDPAYDSSIFHRIAAFHRDHPLAES